MSEETRRLAGQRGCSRVWRERDRVDLLPGYRAVNAAGRTEKTAVNSVIERRYFLFLSLSLSCTPFMIILPSTLSLSLSVSFVSSLSLFQSSFSPRFCPVHRAPRPISLSLPVGNVRPSLHHGIALVPKHYQLVDKAV